MGQMIRVLVIDDHPVVRAGVVGWLTGTDSGIEVVATADTLDAAYTPPGSTADVIVLDLELRTGRISATKAGQLVTAGRRIVVLTQHADPGTIRSLIGVGVCGVLSKDEGPLMCLEAVRDAAGGRFSVGHLGAQAIVTDERVTRARLSPRESETLRLYSYGHPREVIASMMGIEQETVKSNLRRIAGKYAALGREATDRHGLTIRAMEDGVVTLSELGTQIDRRP